MIRRLFFAEGLVILFPTSNNAGRSVVDPCGGERKVESCGDTEIRSDLPCFHSLQLIGLGKEQGVLSVACVGGISNSPSVLPNSMTLEWSFCNLLLVGAMDHHRWFHLHRSGKDVGVSSRICFPFGDSTLSSNRNFDHSVGCDLVEFCEGQLGSCDPQQSCSRTNQIEVYGLILRRCLVFGTRRFACSFTFGDTLGPFLTFNLKRGLLGLQFIQAAEGLALVSIFL